MELIALALRFVLALTFLAAGLSKLPRREAFARAVRRYEVLPPSLARPFAFALPPLELTCGALLGMGVAITPVALLLALALLAFCLAIGINLARGREIDCGCFAGAAPRRIGWPLVVRNLVLAGGAVLVAIDPPRALSLEALALTTESTIPSSDAVAVLLASAVGVTLVALAVQASDLRQLVARREKALL